MKSEGIDVLKSMVFSMISKPISLIINFIYIPILLNYLGIEKYGIWSTILSVLSWIAYCDIGIGNGLRNKLSEELVNANKIKIGKIITSAYIITFSIAIILGLVLNFVFCNLDWNILFSTSQDEQLLIIILISLNAILITFVTSLYKSILYALQKVIWINCFEIVSQLLNLFAVLFLSKYKNENLLVIAISYGVVMIGVNLFANIFVFFKYPYLKPKIKNISLNLGLKLFNLGAQFFIIQVCALILFTTDNILVANLFGAASVTAYSTVNKLFSVLPAIFSALIVPVWSALTKANVKGDFLEIKRTVKFISILIIPFILAIVILVFNYRDIAYIWLRKELEYSNSLIIGGGIYSILTIWCNMYATVNNGIGILKIMIPIAVLQAVINIPLSLFFALTLDMGSSGILFGTIAAMFVSAIVSPILFYRYLNVRTRSLRNIK